MHSPLHSQNFSVTSWHEWQHRSEHFLLGTLTISKFLGRYKPMPVPDYLWTASSMPWSNLTFVNKSCSIYTVTSIWFPGWQFSCPTSSGKSFALTSKPCGQNIFHEQELNSTVHSGSHVRKLLRRKFSPVIERLGRAQQAWRQEQETERSHLQMQTRTKSAS